MKKSLQKEPISVLYVKLAERLHDLKHASGYKDPVIVQAMAKESLTMLFYTLLLYNILS
ncbi:MAG: hypothetical protein NQ127_03020 [Candidatus Cardinium sp.]|nr:hypothetical protein [Candidatus Cardinium sp.]